MTRSWLVRCAAVALALSAMAPLRGQEPIFRLVETVGTLKFVAANRAGVSGYTALRELEALEAFRLTLEVPDLRAMLEKATLTLSLDRMEAVTAAELIAVSAGLDLITERQPPDESGAPGALIATVVKPPSPATEAGRRRLREWALRWYRNLMKLELHENRETQDAEQRIRVDLALLDMAQGNYASAARELQWFAAHAPKHPFLPQAMLKEAECYLELGQYEQAAGRAAEVMKTWRSDAVGLNAALVFARANLARSSAEEEAGRGALASSLLDSVVHTLELFLWGFRSLEEFPDLLLAAAEVHRRRGRPDLVLEKMRELESVVDTILLPQDRWASALFLRGTAEVATGVRSAASGAGGNAESRDLGSGNLESGIKLLWQFLRKAGDDPRVASAWLALAEAEAASGDPLESLFAVRMALRGASQLPPRERSRASVLEGGAWMALGHQRRATDKLQAEIEKLGPHHVPDLVANLGRALLDTGQPERAKRVLRPLRHHASMDGDRVRLLLLEAEQRQRDHRATVRLARELAGEMRSAEAQARLSEIAGDAFAALGLDGSAAAAYSGRVQ